MDKIIDFIKDIGTSTLISILTKLLNVVDKVFIHLENKDIKKENKLSIRGTLHLSKWYRILKATTITSSKKKIKFKVMLRNVTNIKQVSWQITNNMLQ